jgi:hypothetical protein
VQHAGRAGTAGGQVHTSGTATPNTFLAGYYTHTSSGLASASATLRIPNISCASSGDNEDVGFGVFGVVSNSSLDSQADAQVGCANGGTFYFLAAYSSGNGNTIVANPGDLVVASLYENGSTTVATIHDVTSGKTVTHSGSAGFDTAVNTGAYNYYYPGNIPTFTSVAFSKCQVNGDYLVYGSPAQFNMHPTHEREQIAAGTIASSGDAFKLIFKNNR